MLKTDTFTELKTRQIKRNIMFSNPSLTEPSDIEVINVALTVFELICEAHTDNESDLHLIVEDMLDNAEMFNEYVADLIFQVREKNIALDEFIKEKIQQKTNGVK